jgi:DNA replication protein DnaC
MLLGYNASMRLQATQICADCGGSGWLKVVREGVEGVVRCDCLKLSRTDRLLEKAKIPLRYAHCELENFELRAPHTTQSLERAKLAAEKFSEEYPMTPPFGLLFMGRQGIGKTHLAVGILKHLMRHKGVECLFRTFPELLKEIQNSYNPNTQASELSLLTPVLETEVLVLDELGAQTPSLWVQETVSYVLNHRYNENKVTILTTNYFDEEDRKSAKSEESDKKNARFAMNDTLADRIGVRMRSRLYEMCKTIRMDGNDFRKAVKQAEHHF